MENREDALDFIYKGWREGRQQRRNVVRQRGLDRTRSMLAPIMAQRARGSMASMPPSMPVEETRVPTEASPVENVAETVSMPPASPLPENDMTDDITDDSDHPDDLANHPGNQPMSESRMKEVEERSQAMEEERQEALRTKEGEQPMTEEDWSNVESSPVPILVAHHPETGDTLQISSDPLPTEEEFERDYPGYVIGKHPEHEKAFEEAYGKMKEEATKTEKIPSPPKATEEGKEKVKRLGDNLARWGIFGEGDEEPSDN